MQTDSFDAFGNHLGAFTFKYDVFNRRVVKSGYLVNYFVYDTDDVVFALNSAGTVRNRYLHGPAVDEVLADEQFGGTVLWPLKDQFYNVRDLVNNAGTHYNHYDYDSFGIVTGQWNNGTNLTHAYGFQSRERDLETGLNYHRNRYYNPSIGRWISEDPIGFAAGDVNLNRFVANAPTFKTDPSGLKGWGTFTASLQNSGSDLWEGSLLYMTWYPERNWLKPGSCNCKHVGIFQIVRGHFTWRNGWFDNFDERRWHFDGPRPGKARYTDYVHGEKVETAAMEGQTGKSAYHAQIADEPGVNYNRDWLGRDLTFYDQEFETGAVCLDENSNHYLEVFGTIKWGHSYVRHSERGIEEKLMWVEDPLRKWSVVSTSVNDLGISITTDGEFLLAGRKPSDTFIKLVGAELNGWFSGRVHW